MRKGVGNPADGRPLTVAGTTIRTSVEDDLRVNGADFDFRLAGGNAEGGVTLGRPYASAFSHVNGWPTPQAGASLMADAQGLARVNYGGTVTGAAGQAGTVTIRGRFGEVAVGAASGLVASSGTVEELVSVGVSTPGQLRCALPPCFDSERLYAELIGSGSALISVEYGYELSVAVQAGDMTRTIPTAHITRALLLRRQPARLNPNEARDASAGVEPTVEAVRPAP